MRRVAREDLLDWATYDDRRGELRPRAIAEKERRRVALGEHLTFLFESYVTVLYQIQEMMRAERIVREEDIRHEIETYNELLGGPGELGCTLLIAVEDPDLRVKRLREWLPLLEHVYVRRADGKLVRARFDARQRGEDRLSSVQYLKFATGNDAPVALGTDLPALRAEVAFTDDQRAALAEDLRG